MHFPTMEVLELEIIVGFVICHMTHLGCRPHLFRKLLVLDCQVDTAFGGCIIVEYVEMYNSS
jgi:hypothetical protein